MKMCEQFLKKDSAPIQFEFFELKNQEKANNSPSYRCATIKKTLSITVQHLSKTSALAAWLENC